MLLEITLDRFSEIRGRHRDDGGDAINEKISQMFQHFHDDTCYEDVRIKVAVINTLYNTAIGYIDPVAKCINAVFSQVKDGTLDASDHVALVDLIADTAWTNRLSEEKFRKNLSFASKYMHFQSKGALPIYDSYVWIMMVGYLRLAGIKLKFTKPKSYRDFYRSFLAFKEKYGLSQQPNYDIDKFLWQYGRQLVSEIEAEMKQRGMEPDLPKARRELEKRLRMATA